MDDHSNDVDERERGTARNRGRAGVLAVAAGAMLAGGLIAGGLVFALGSDDSSGGDRESSAASATDTKRAQGMAFVECIRENGVPDFPDPGPNGAILIDPASGVDVQGAAYQKAEKACKSLMPEGRRAPGPPPGGVPDVTGYVNCMRENGVPDFPDAKNGGFAPEEAGIDVGSASFQAAHKACQKHLPEGAPPPA